MSDQTPTVDVQFYKPINEYTLEKAIPASCIPREGDAVILNGRAFRVHTVSWDFVDGFDKPSVRVVLR